jgi:hypothetical protein
LLSSTSVKNTVHMHERKLLVESQDYIFENALNPRVLARWQRTAHVGKMKAMRMPSGYGKEYMSPDSSDGAAAEAAATAAAAVTADGAAAMGGGTGDGSGGGGGDACGGGVLLERVRRSRARSWGGCAPSAPRPFVWCAVMLMVIGVSVCGSACFAVPLPAPVSDVKRRPLRADLRAMRGGPRLDRDPPRDPPTVYM